MIHYFRLAAALLLCMVLANANATSQCFQWQASRASSGASPWSSSAKEALDWLVSTCNASQAAMEACAGGYGCAHSQIVAGTCTQYAEVSNIAPGFSPWYWYTYTWKLTFNTAPFGPQTYTFNAQGVANRTNPNGCKVFVSTTPPDGGQCGANCNSVGHPIDPVDGSVFDTAEDLPSSAQSLNFKRFYDSSDKSASTINQGWRHSYSRSIRNVQSGSTFKPFTASPSNSSQYNDESSACTSGFAEIKSEVSAWASATASYSNSTCKLSVGSTVIGYLPLYYTSTPTPAPGSTTTIAYEAIRDDGQRIAFTVDGSSIDAPPGINLKLQSTGGGYALTDANDAIESYDANGRLLSITSRSDVVQAMGYDASGRLISVSDSFGHSLTLSYDALGRLSTVTRP